jgi:hypothetical protein
VTDLGHEDQRKYTSPWSVALFAHITDGNCDTLKIGKHVNLKQWYSSQYMWASSSLHAILVIINLFPSKTQHKA